MKNKLKLSFTLLIACALVFAAVLPIAPVSRASSVEDEAARLSIGDTRDIPAGYNLYEYERILDFLEFHEEGSSIRNGNRLSPNYDPWDPATWGWKNGAPRFQWQTYEGEKHLARIDVSQASGQLTGMIELYDFPILNFVDCSDNYLLIGISNAPSLVHLDCHNNRAIYSSIDVSASVDLEYLDCKNAYSRELDLRSNTELRYLNCSEVSALDISACTKLEHLGASYTGSIEGMDISHLPLLKTLDLTQDRNILNLDFSANPLLESIRCSGCNLRTLDVSMLPELKVLECSGNWLSELDVSVNTQLEVLYCGNNLLDTLDLVQNTKLTRLYCKNNEIAVLDLSNMPQLEVVNCSNNNITALDFSSSPLLWGVSCSYNKLTQIDFESNPAVLFDHVYTSGSGYVGYKNSSYEMPEEPGEAANSMLFATTANGSEFVGWYDLDGNLVSEQTLLLIDSSVRSVVAVFTGGEPQPALPGDADGNGTVNIADGITALRFTLGIIDESAIVFEAADINGDGSVSVADAILILRIALGVM